MSDELLKASSGLSLQGLATRIYAAHRACEAALTKGLQHALEAGRALIEAKARLPHGEWLSWVTEHCNVSPRMAQHYMRLSRARPKLSEENAKRISHLSVRRIVQDIARGSRTSAAPNRVIQVSPTANSYEEAASRAEFIARREAIDALDHEIKEHAAQVKPLIRQLEQEKDQLHKDILMQLPGLFIEKCPPDENCKLLTKDEIDAYVTPVMQMGLWHKIGFEAGREYGAVSFRADVQDLDIVNPGRWMLGDLCPDKCYRRWAVEFPKDGGYVRCMFWFASKYKVPALDERGKPID